MSVMIQLKHALYDWYGYNQKLFDHIHNTFTNRHIVDGLIYITKYLGEYMLFPIHFLVLLAFMVLYSRYYKQDVDLQVKYIKTSIVLVTTFVIGAVFVEVVKLTSHFPRPYCSGNIILSKLITSIENLFTSVKCYKSLPSGHSWYAAAFVISLWHIMNVPFKIIGLLLVLSIGLSRIVVGMHFPADVACGYLIAIVTFMVVKRIVKSIFINYKTSLRRRLQKM